MAEGPLVDSPDFVTLVSLLSEALYDPAKLKRVEKAMGNAQASAQTVAHGAVVKAVADAHSDQKALTGHVEDNARGAVGFILSHLVGHLLGIDVPPSALRGAFSGGSESVVGKALSETIFSGIEGNTQQLAPGAEGAKRLIGMLSNLTLTSWFEGIILQWAESFGGILHPIQSTSELGRELIEGLGLSRLARVALRPLAQTLIATPLEWDVYKRFRPTLLGAGDVARQVGRGKWNAEQATEELARAGYSDDRIEALLTNAAKYLTVEDLAWMLWQEIVGQDEAVTTLRNQGYDEQTASKHLIIQGLKREDTIHREVAGAATTAFVDGRIDDGQLVDMLDATIPSGRERDLLIGAARAKRALRVLPLSPAEAAAAVKAGILAFVDYRRVLELAGRSPDAVDVLELLLRKEINDKAHVAELKQQQQVEKDAAAKTKAAAVAKAKAAADAKTALARRGSIQELTRAVVRGLVPLARLDEVLVAEFDSDTAAIYAADADQQRQAYLAQQQKAADAAKRAAAAGLSTGELQTALVDGVLTADQVRAQLASRQLAPADVDVLLATMQQRAAEHAAAVKLRDAAALKARTKTISLAQAESLVRGGHWTTAQYQTYVAALGYGEADVAYLVELLADQIAKDRTAAALRKSVTAGDPGKGLSLAQFRQAVIIGASSIDAFQTFLVNEGYTADAQAILVAELRDAVTAADAARARRTAAAGAVDGSTVALSDVTRAARLGLITVDQYRAQLTARGFSDDEIALEVDLLITEIAAAKSADTAAGAGLGTSGAPPVDAVAAATARHVTIDGELAVRGLSLSEIEAGVKAGLVTIDAYQAWLESNGYGQADAELLRALLVAKLPAAGG